MCRHGFGAIGVVLEHRPARREFGLLLRRRAPIGKVRRGGNPDQRVDLRGDRQRGQQHQPPAHRRSDQRDRSRTMRRDQRQQFLAPARQRAIGKVPAAEAAARIVQQQAGAAVVPRPVEHRAGLAPRHVGFVARQEHQCGADSSGVVKSNLAPIGHGVKAGIGHALPHAPSSRDMPLRCHETPIASATENRGRSR